MTPDAGAPDTTGLISFSQQIQPMINSKCISCHGAVSPDRGIRLDTYANVKLNGSKALKEITAGAMPPTGGLPTANRQMFQDWVDQGMQNN